MKVCMASKTFDFTVGGYVVKQFKQAKSYVMSEMLMRDISNAIGNDSFGSIRDLSGIYRRYNGESLDGKRIAIWRTGGMGDLCFITPYLKKLKEMWPTCTIVFGCGVQYADAMNDHEYIDEFHCVPMDTDVLGSCEYHLMFEGIIEANPEAEKINAYDLFGKVFGMTLDDSEKVPNLPLNEDSCAHFVSVEKQMNLKVKNPVRVGIHLKTSSVIRNVPASAWVNIISGMLSSHDDIVIYLLGAPEDIDVGNKISLPSFADGRIVPFFHFVRGFKDSIAAISKMDLVIGGDSSGMHIAAAFQKPMIGLFGAFLGALRLGYYENAIAINSEIRCSPCFQHGNTSCDNSDIMGNSYCMMVFDIAQVVDEAMMLLAITHKVEVISLTPHASNVALAAYKEYFANKTGSMEKN